MRILLSSQRKRWSTHLSLWRSSRIQASLRVSQSDWSAGSWGCLLRPSTGKKTMRPFPTLGSEWGKHCLETLCSCQNKPVGKVAKRVFESSLPSMHQDATGYVCLLIQPTKKEDAGWYTVSAKNEAGIISCTARLDIYGERTPFTFLIFIINYSQKVILPS